MEIETKKYYIYHILTKCLTFVKDFAHENNLILVGGQSLDYAFRLKGRQLYEDWELPDYDFVSDDSVNIAYDLFEKVNKFLFGRSLDEPQKMPVSVISGLHSTTMRILIYRDSIADITYAPKEIYEIYKLSALNYNNMFVRHPFLQCVDMQRSLSYPYENPMMEVILFRWKKDFERMKMILDIYNPSDKELVNKFIECYNKRSKNGPPNLAKVGSGKLPNAQNKAKYSTDLDPSDRRGIYKNYVNLDKKEIIQGGCVAGELAFLLYYSIYSKKRGKTPRFDNFIDGDFYLGSHYFMNSYIMTKDDIKVLFGQKPVLAKHHKVAAGFMDMLPTKIVSEGFEFLELTHKACYHVLDLNEINPKYPKVQLQVVSFNFVIMQMVVMWMIFKHDMYLSMYLKMLRMLKKIYSWDFDKYARLLYPSIQPYGDELEETAKTTEDRPEPIYVNEYISPLKAFAKIKEYEYPDSYNLAGV